MQFIVSQARKEGMISTGIDLFLAAVPATLVALDIAKDDMLGLSGNKTATYIIGGIRVRNFRGMPPRASPDGDGKLLTTGWAARQSAI